MIWQWRTGQGRGAKFGGGKLLGALPTGQAGSGEKILQQLKSVFREDGFGMKLYAKERVSAMA